jgi:hypothetical protein
VPCERARVVAVSVSPMAVLEVRIGEQPVDAQTNSSRPTMELKMPSMAVSETLNVVRRMPAKETQRWMKASGHGAGARSRKARPTPKRGGRPTGNDRPDALEAERDDVVDGVEHSVERAEGGPAEEGKWITRSVVVEARPPFAVNSGRTRRC